MKHQEVIDKLKEAVDAIPKPPALSEITNEELSEIKSWVTGVLLIVQLDAKTRVWSDFLATVIETGGRIEQVKKEQFVSQFEDRPVREDK